MVYYLHLLRTQKKLKTCMSPHNVFKEMVVCTYNNLLSCCDEEKAFGGSFVTQYASF